jgi:hypothetical protein
MPEGTVFADVARLSSMSAHEAATVIHDRHIPFLVAVGALGKRLKEDDALGIALIESMSSTELVTNMKMLERIGVRSRPALRSALEEGLSKAASSKKASFKTSVAAEAVESVALKAKLGALQEKQIDRLGSVDGNWLVLGDKSGSMEKAIDLSRQVAATLARVVKDEVLLIFFDTDPRAFEVRGETYEELRRKTGLVHAGGGTSIGCGLQYALEKGFTPNGIAIVSDAAENNAPLFADVYERHAEEMGFPPVYLYKTDGEQSIYYRGAGVSALEDSMKEAHLDLQVFDLREGKTDYYSLPNLIATMRTSRYSLVDEILATPLLTLRDVFKDAA